MTLAGMQIPAAPTSEIALFEQIYADSADSARVMAISIHPYIMGAPHRVKYFRRVIEHIDFLAIDKKDVAAVEAEVAADEALEEAAHEAAAEAASH